MKYELLPFDEGDAEYIEEQLAESSFSAAPPEEGAEDDYVLLKITDDEGNIIGGCIVIIDRWKIADLDTLWVREKYRRQGLGSALIREAERLCREKGCYLMTLGTFDFQARPLYEKHGFTVCGLLEDCPRGHEHYDMIKRLDRPSPDCVPKDHGAEALYTIRPGSAEDAYIITDGLDRYCDRIAPDLHEYIDINLKLTDAGGRLIAGVSAGIDGWDGCDLDVLWVEEPYRGRGLGAYLLRKVERAARERGAYVMLTNASDWNMGFFKKQGYAVRGTLEDHPRGHRSFELEKRL